MKALRTLKDLSFDPIEIKVREATNNDPIGASSTLMADIAQATHNYRLYAKCYAMLWKRLCDLEHILHVQKALILVEYLLRNGHERFLNDVKKNSRDIVRLTKYKYYNKDHEDIAHDVRFKAAIVADLLNNTEKLSAERKKAEGMRGIRLQAVSHEDVSHQKTVETQWSSIDKEKEKAAKEAKDAAAAKAKQKTGGAKKAAAPAPAPAAAADGSDDDGEGAPAGTASIEDDPFGNPPADPEPAPVQKKKPQAAAAAPAKKPAAKPKPQVAAAEEGSDDDEAAAAGPRRASGEDPEFAHHIHAAAAPAPKPAAAAQPKRSAAPQQQPQAAAAIADPFNIFDVGMSASARPVQQQPAGDVDLLTTGFSQTAIRDTGFVDVSAPKKAPSPAPALVKGQSNVDRAAPAAGGNNELWQIDGLVSVDDLTGARRANESKKPQNANSGAVSMGEMNQLKNGLGGGNLLDGFGGPAATPVPRASATANGSNNLLANNPFFAPAPSPSPFVGLNTIGAPVRVQQPPAAQPAGSNPFADLGFG